MSSRLATRKLRDFRTILFNMLSELGDTEDAIGMEVHETPEAIAKQTSELELVRHENSCLSYIITRLDDYVRKEEEKDDAQIDHASMSIPDLAICLKSLKDELDLLGSLKTEVQKRYDFLSIDVIPDRMDEEGIETIRVVGVGRLQTQSDIRCSVPASNRELVEDWLRDNGQEALISSTVNASTFKAFVKEQMKTETPDNVTYPKHLIKVDPYSRAVIVKG